MAFKQTTRLEMFQIYFDPGWDFKTAYRKAKKKKKSGQRPNELSMVSVHSQKDGRETHFLTLFNNSWKVTLPGKFSFNGAHTYWYL